MKIGILTTFYNFDPAYSLISVVTSQLKMLEKHGYEPVLFVLDNTSVKDIQKYHAQFKDIEIRPVIPQLILEPYGAGNLENLESDVKKAKGAFNSHMQDIDVCLTHDIIFVNSYLPYNIALREAIEENLKDVKWLHWMHSGPSERPNLDGSPFDNLYTLPKNSKLVYMNDTDKIRAAEMYGVWDSDVRVISNAMDIRDLYEFHDITRAIIEENDIMKADVICAYPLSSTRMDKSGKQLSKVITIMGQLKAQGSTVRLIVCNAHANASKEKQEIKRMKEWGLASGLGSKELIFTSLHDVPNNESGVPHQVIRDMFTLSNIFIFPTVSENCPLVLLEAMAGKNLLVLNGSFKALREFALDGAYYVDFGALGNTVNYPEGEGVYLMNVAKLLTAELNNNRIIKANKRLRRYFNIDYIFKQQLEPAIMELVQKKE